MAIAGSPRKLARDIADGFFSLSPPMLRQYNTADLKTIIANLAVVTRELRNEQISPDAALAIKAKNMKLSRLHLAETVIRAFCKKARIPI